MFDDNNSEELLSQEDSIEDPNIKSNQKSRNQNQSSIISINADKKVLAVNTSSLSPFEDHKKSQM